MPTFAELMEKDRYETMMTVPVRGLICRLAVPTVISMLVTALYNLADTFFVSSISTQATAAVGVAFSLMSVIQAIGYFFGHGTGNFISRRLGARDEQSARRMAATGFVYAISFGVLLTLLGEIFLRPLCVALGSTPTILPYTLDYLRIILLGAPFMIGSLVLNTQLRFQGHALISMVGIVSGAVLNVFLAPLFIFYFGMGISGAAVATVLCQAFSFFLLLAMDRRLSSVPIRLGNFSSSGTYVYEVIRGGSPSFSRQALACLATLLLNHAAGAYGDAAIAAMSIVTRTCFFLFSFLLGIGQGFQPVCGFNYGAGNYARVRQGYWFCVRIGTLFLLLCSVVGWIWAEEVVGIFRSDADVVAIGATALRWQLLVLPLNAYVAVSNMMLQTIRKSIPAVVLASARQGLFFIPLIFLLPSAFGLLGVEVCQPVSDLLSFVLAVPLTTRVLREMRRR